ncbi:MAG TPA: amino acid permease [Flavisolibacter sp.]|nr:amino acid permease [Flavisolibacter sp.]
MNLSAHKLGLFSAISIVISSMIGTGVFTSLGLQVAGLPSVFAIIVLWIVGGIVAICGALNYGELAVAFPRSGGEYNYLSILYHPLLGFLSAFVSAIVGFAAPAALSSMAFAYYFKSVSGIDATVLTACTVLVLLTLVHSFNLKLSSILQNISTGINILLIVFFIVSGFIKGPHDHFIFTVNSKDISLLFSDPFAVSLVYVYFAYTGWNSAIYIASEISRPERNLSLSLTSATILVMILYILLNLVFLLVTPMVDLSGKIDIGFISANAIFGIAGGKIIAIIICVALLASVSSYLFFGPRILQVLGEDYHLLRFFKQKNRHGIPLTALFFQAGIAFLLIITDKFDALLSITSIVLSLFTTFTVAGVFLLRKNKDKYGSGFKAVGYPLTCYIFLLIECWMIYYTFKVKTIDSLAGLGFLVIGILLYFALVRNRPGNLI